MSSIRNRPRSAAISGPMPSSSGGACVGPGQVDPHPAAPLVGRHRRRPEAVELRGVEVLAVGHAHHEPRRVVDPAVVRAREPAGAAPDEFAHDRRAPVLAHVVERGERPVGLPGDDDGLAVALEGQPVAGVDELLGAPGDDPVAGEHTLAFQLETHGIEVHVGVHRARAVVGECLHARAEPDGDVATCRDVDHRCSLE